MQEYCNNFETSYCILNNKKISTSDYKSLKDNLPNKIHCHNGHELVFCSPTKTKDYFRHKMTNICTNNKMTEWHKDWQNNFKNYTEKTYKKHCSMQIALRRRADVDLNQDSIIEFQHSIMSIDEATNRKNDWKLNNKSINWIIYGGDTIEITQLDEQRVLLYFKTEPWKYESYVNYEFIFIDVLDSMYIINPKLVKSRMIEAQCPINKIDFMDKLKNNEQLIDNNIIKKQTHIYVKQQGAGNGKTFGIIQLLVDKNYKHYDTFIYLTKQHSAKHIIKSEIISQQERGLLNDVLLEEEEFLNKKYILTFVNKKTKKKKKIIIGTFDSFIYALGDTNVKGVDKFISMVNSIIDSEIRCSELGNFKYAKGNVKLNKKLLLIGDEMQDLHENYVKAIIKITRERYVDFYAVGDKLQSISIEQNAFTYLENELPDVINKYFEQPTNICRRFNNKNLVEFVNHMINFDKYKLPCITTYCNDANNLNMLTFIPHKTIYSDEKDNDKINGEVVKIMKYYKYEVETCNRQPNDFLIITPFVSTNPYVEVIHTCIREYWINKTGNNKYIKYSVFHKSDTGNSIDLSESDDATRIVSIHSSKGDGRAVVFVIGVSENALKVYSNVSNNLIYESLLHVSLTRMKEKLYFALDENGDMIHQKITEYENKNNTLTIKPYLCVKSSLKLQNCLKNQQLIYDTFKKTIMSKLTIQELVEETSDKEIIDMKHHFVRYASFYMCICLNIIIEYNKLNKSNEQPIYQILNKFVRNWTIITCKTSKSYYDILKGKDFEDGGFLPISISTSKLGNYKEYTIQVLKHVDNVKKLVGKILNNKSNEVNLSYIEILVLYHVYSVINDNVYSRFPINDLYDVIHAHNEDEKKKQQTYVMMHYNKLSIINNIFSIFHNEYSHLKYLVGHVVKLEGNSNLFKIYSDFEFIAYNKDMVIIIYLKPQFSALNYNETLIRSMYETYIIKNVKKLDDEDKISENYKRFNNKKIITCVLTFDNNKKPYYIKWNDKNNNCLIEKNNIQLTECLKKRIFEHYQSFHMNIYLFCKYYHKQTTQLETIDIIGDILDNYISNNKKHGTSHPNYICEFLHEIQYEIKQATRKKKNSKDILNGYMKEKTFIENLNINLEESIDRYLIN
jgi:hypothetical protein